MHRVLLTASRLCLLAFLLAGVLAVAGQSLGLLLGSGSLVKTFGGPVTDLACVTAAIAGVLAFLLRYTAEGRASATEE
ncbi:hypothetical protein M8C13_02860 [Crossiella sp. SN42]|uniref:hypothetical protein n=1 Tax=Crossiella sp. SN42 TaxID=2944808 RepID=UPI00207CDE47|nr:hypothetical protein [Crossiella sp. SN42]MCO1574697.1 hypothetical protein [Crossiella sp. SN42]